MYFFAGVHRLLVTNKGGRFSPAQTTVKVNCKLLCQYQYVLLNYKQLNEKKV
jgi:hypothetical protein